MFDTVVATPDSHRLNLENMRQYGKNRFDTQ